MTPNEIIETMTQQQKEEITKISKDFARGFKDMFGGINGTGWLIVDPLAGFLSSIGYENTLHQLPATNTRPQVLIIEFKDGTQFIPAGKDLAGEAKGAKNWLWIDPSSNSSTGTTA